MIALEHQRAAAIVLGAEPLTAWRPSDKHLSAIVDCVARVQAERATIGALVDVGDVLDELRAGDPAWPWPAFICDLLARWDEHVEAAAGRRNLLALGRLAGQTCAALEVRVDALLKAREEADRALSLANRACDLFEREARTLAAATPPESRDHFTPCEFAAARPAAANDLRVRRSA